MNSYKEIHLRFTRGGSDLAGQGLAEEPGVVYVGILGYRFGLVVSGDGVGPRALGGLSLAGVHGASTVRWASM